MNSKLEIERWERQWRICRLHDWGHFESDFDPSGRSVLEVGCGPMLGFGPVAMFRGAERYWYVEPDLKRSVLESIQLKNEYFQPLFEELTANYGELWSFDEWYTRVLELSQTLPAGMENGVDITLSHSVLEHIPLIALPQLLTRLYVASRPGGRFFHTVDFGSHGGPLSSLYNEDQAIGRQQLNLLRLSEIQAAISEAGFDQDASIVYKADEIVRSEVHHSWQKYSKADLESRVVFIIGGRASVTI